MKHKLFWAAVVVFLVVTGIISVLSYQNNQPLVYRENLDRTVLTVDERKLSLGDLAYYIAAEELEIDSQARVYDRENTNTYWGLRFGGLGFMKPKAKELVLDTAIHDEIFYQMAIEADISLNEEEQQLLESREYDFWSDLTEEQRERIGVKEQELRKRMEEIALAQKYQFIYAMEHSIISEDYEINGEAYQELLEEHKVKIEKSVWSRIPFGTVILDPVKTEEAEG